MDTKRFHNPEYKKQIKAVRTYRRQVKATPETNLGKIVRALGLESFWSKFFVVLAVAALVYLVFFAQFLFVKNIQISGATQEAQDSINANFQEYKKKFVNLLPQKNILFFSTKGFSKYIEEENHHVAKVISSKKEYWNTLVVEIDQRVPAYVLKTNGYAYILNSDGTIGSMLYEPTPVFTETPFEVEEEPLQPTLPNLPVLTDISGQKVAVGDIYFNEKQAEFIRYIRENFEKQTSLAIKEFVVPSKASEQLNILTTKEFAVYFTNTLDPQTYLERLRAMLIQLTPEQQGRLAYLDLRFEKNAYGCYKGDPCSN